MAGLRRRSIYPPLLAFLFLHIAAMPVEAVQGLRMLVVVVILGLAAWSSSPSRALRIVGMTLAGLTAVLIWNGGSARLAALIISGTYGLFVTGVVIADVITQRRVTFQVLCGALSAYLMLALSWALFYMLAESLTPGSFHGLPEGEMPVMQNLQYFSIVTLTTLGYGDISPVTPTAQAMVAVQALVGQLFLAVLVARIVALHLLDREEEEDAGA